MHGNTRQVRKGRLSALAAASALVGALFFAGKEIDDYENSLPQESYVGADRIGADNISKYGKVVYEKNPDAPNTIYILPEMHRSSKKNVTKNTPAVQRNIYYIGGILVREKGMRLVLKEGRYASTDYARKNNLSKQQVERDYGIKRIFDGGAVEDFTVIDILTREDNAFDASHLIALKFPDVDLQGWEDKESLGKAAAAHEKGKKNPADEAARAEYGYFNSIRSCDALLNAPEVAKKEFGAGRIPNMNAIVIIGKGHAPQIKSFLSEGRCMEQN